MLPSPFFDSWVPYVALVIVTLVTCVYGYSNYCFNYWKRKGIPYVEGKFPFGSIGDLALLKTSLTELNLDLYKKSKGKKYIGYYTFFQPQLLVRDLDLIKNILVKDFSTFTDRGVYFNEEEDPLSAHLFSLEGLRWKNLRAKLSPTFTSGKMKTMFHTMRDSAKDLQDYTSKITKKNDIINCKDITSRYGLDVISSTALGLKGNNFVEDKTEIKRIADMFIAPSFIQMARITLTITCKNIAEYFRLRFTPKLVEEFFLNMVEQTVNYRQKNNAKRNDFMQLLLDLKNDGDVADDKEIAKKETQVKLTIKEMAAQAFVFVIAGFETSSATLSFCLYELALNHEIQNKLFDELDAAGPEITYEILNQLPYLEMVVNETMRMYPSVPSLQRECSRDYELPGGEVIQKGTVVVIPVIGLHRDPDLFPNPEKFDPKRFSKENIQKILPYSYMPFGEGPRICIGSRFGKMQVKLALHAILSRFTVDVCEKTTIPVKPERKTFGFNAEGGIQIRMTERKK